jgi:chromosomal replication initiator protein
MLDAWLNRTRGWLAAAEKLLALPEQEFALWALSRAVKPGSTHPVLCICGETGSGKSALIRHVLAQQAAVRKQKIIAADATEWSLWLSDREAEGHAVVPEHGANLVICEDLQQLHDPRADGDRLAFWIDQVRAAGMTVILTADRLPSQIEDLSPRLVNRLQGGLLAGIRPWSDASQQRLLQHRPAAGTVLPQTRSTEMVAAGSTGLTDDVSLDGIAEAVAINFQVSLADLCSGTRTQQLKIPRGVAMSLARELTSCSLLTIGRYFGCRSHTSVVRGCSRLQELLPDAPTLRQQVQLLRTKLRRNVSADCG